MKTPTSSIRSTLLAVALCAASATCAAQSANAHEPLQDRPGATTSAPVATPLLHEMFQAHAVLQRNAPIRVWGQAQPGQAVQVTLARRKASARADENGRWVATLPPMAAGGPYTLNASAQGGAKQTVNDVMVGEVWLCSGQSNMVLQVHRTLDSRAEIEGSGNDSIRMLTVGETGSVTELEHFATPVKWLKAAPATVPDFSAACFYYARELQKTVKVPMGLVTAAWGGSRIQAWTSAGALRASGQYNDELDVLATYANDPVDAVAKWGEVWGKWWRGRKDVQAGDEPWADKYSATTGWRNAPPALGPWEEWGVKDLAAYDGMVWFRTSVNLTAAQAAQDAVLLLGAIDEVDTTWVNGRGVGSTYGPGSGREYVLPAGLLHAGENSVAINVLDTYRAGGMSGPASAYALRLKDGTTVPLDSAWKYRTAPGTDSPPRAPWQTASGLSTLYNGMIAPIGKYGFRGMLWYQGESNTFEADRYADLLRMWRNDWRTRFGANLPALIVQLAGYGMPKTQPAESGWAGLREAQRIVANEDAHSGLAVAIDIGDHYDIHPANKQELARRLARAARHVVYGDKQPPSGPVPASARREGDAVAVTFADVTDGLVAFGADGPIGFELCGATQDSCHYADARISGNNVTLRAPAIANVTRVRYCWADGPVCTLFDGASLPAGPFETPIQ
ncbi:sialate O-acetylesterase [Lysobacter sp. TAF61]|uniref:sialate O-acetylesterase n=1 Tax=Lysobacter sp. TAF61 TaxID=3233072 RepID=UPI003F9CB685